eukprot:12425553-Karenia_brevis.AAC.1
MARVGICSVSRVADATYIASRAQVFDDCKVLDGAHMWDDGRVRSGDHVDVIGEWLQGGSQAL